ncbi:uncharacterized protein LOC112512255 [Cynara cardunculus var. scolymus]|uniref:uncharacterized protein LOC112512255 n=1 Tax=Cynara cardunculus var. scolymus TaxID=59895 RepID=UPI000D625165|nr:uncharacterized protein LOC112512255 [Cynara cardunculus var. scolymus]
MARVVEETFKEEKGGGVRWYVMADDDTVFLPENLVEVLKKYDHNGYYYVGMNSESIISNSLFSFGMGFGGAGFALSYPLVELLVKNLDGCLKKYHGYHGSDHILQSCMADLGVSLTQERGFHQIDLHGDISGLLAAHPQAPMVSLHHLDAVEPLFPTMDRLQSLNHLMKAAKTDQSRLFQQSICYDHPKDWTFSLSWGYSLHIYEKILPPSVLQVPLQTFGEWRKGAKPAFMVNTRGLSKDPCEIPHTFYFDSVVDSRGRGNPEEVIMSYVRKLPRRLPPCLASGNQSAHDVEKILVISPVTRLETVLNRSRSVIFGIQFGFITMNQIEQMLSRFILNQDWYHNPITPNDSIGSGAVSGFDILDVDTKREEEENAVKLYKWTKQMLEPSSLGLARRMK